MDVREWIGPQSGGDATDRRRHRFHQSWYRAFVLGLPPGTGPKPKSTAILGSMLRAEDATDGRNFLTDEIDQIAQERIAQGGTVEPFRCRHNLLSSQPMCFNLFGPLVNRPGMAAAFVEAVTGREVEVEDKGIRIEDPRRPLGDNTGLDASIRYRTIDGDPGILGIETKLTEQFSPKVYELDSRPAYGRYTRAESSPFRPPYESLTDSRWNQLWRNQMMCEAIKHEDGLAHAEQVVVFPGDLDKTANLVGDYAALLARPEAVSTKTLTAVLDIFERAAAHEDRGWLQAFRTRYVDLHLSEPLFAAWHASVEPFAS